MKLHIIIPCFLSLITILFAQNTSYAANSNDVFARFLRNTISSQISEEKIVFGVDKDYASAHSDWQANANELMTFINEVLAKNTQKRFSIGKFITFDESKAKENNIPSYHLFDNDGNCSISIMVYHFAPETAPKDFLTGNYYGNHTINEKLCGFVHIQEDNNSLLNGIEYFKTQFGVEIRNSIWSLPDWEISYQLNLLKYLHEIGHSLGLGQPEHYYYKLNTDRTGMKPTLQAYDYTESFPQDPMAGVQTVGYEFTDLDAYIINRNLNNEFHGGIIESFVPKTIYVKIVGQDNKPLRKAKVRVFGVNKLCSYSSSCLGGEQPLLQKGTTDKNGLLKIKAPRLYLKQSESYGFAGVIVKAEFNSKKGGAFLSTLNLQRSKILNYKDKLILKVAVY